MGGGKVNVNIPTYQGDPLLFEAVEKVAVDCGVFVASVHLFSLHATAVRHTLHHQLLTDRQRSEMIRPAAATTNQLSW